MRVFKYFILLLCFKLLFNDSYVFSQIETLNFPNKIEIKKSETSKSDKQVTVKLNNFDETTKTTINPDDLIHVGDFVDVDVIGSTEYDWRGEINPEGFLAGLKFIDNVLARCRSEESISNELTKLYSEFLRNPKVSVKILDRSKRPISTLLGEIKNAQKYQLKRKVHLNELLILSGGITEKANGEIQILRRPENSCQASFIAKRDKISSNNKGKFIKVSQDNGFKVLSIKISDLLSGKEEANPQILYGDIITVLGADPIYVIGGVNRPGKILFRDEITVSRAISIAGGLSQEKNSGDVRIFRKDGNNTTIINTDLDLIKSGEKTDVILKPYDIVDVAGNESKRRYSPLLDVNQSTKVNNVNLPLRVID